MRGLVQIKLAPFLRKVERCINGGRSTEENHVNVINVLQVVHTHFFSGGFLSRFLNLGLANMS